MTSGHVGARGSPGPRGFHPTSLTSEKGKHLFPGNSSKTPSVIGLVWVTSPALIHCDQDGSRSGPCHEPTFGVLEGVGITWIWSVEDEVSQRQIRLFSPRGGWPPGRSNNSGAQRKERVGSSHLPGFSYPSYHFLIAIPP